MYRKIIIDSREKTTSSGSGATGSISLSQILSGDYVIEKFTMPNQISNITSVLDNNTFTVDEGDGLTYDVTISDGYYNPYDLDLYLSQKLTTGSLDSGKGYTYLVTYNSTTGKFTFESTGNFSITYSEGIASILGFTKPTSTTTTTTSASTLSSDISANTKLNYIYLEITEDKHSRNAYIYNTNWTTSFIVPIENTSYGDLIIYNNTEKSNFVITFSKATTLSYRFHDYNDNNIGIGDAEWQLIIHRI